MNLPNPHDLVRAAAGAVVGAAITWGASGLVVQGRVSALEASMARIELRLDQLLTIAQKRD